MKVRLCVQCGGSGFTGREEDEMCTRCGGEGEEPRVTEREPFRFDRGIPAYDEVRDSSGRLISRTIRKGTK